MKRLIIQTRKFSETLDQLVHQKKLIIEDFQEFEKELVSDPKIGDVIQGTGGIRKIRLKSSGKGKSGGFRVCYIDIPEKEKLFLILLYGKNEQEDLSSDEKKILKNLTDRLKKE